MVNQLNSLYAYNAGSGTGSLTTRRLRPGYFSAQGSPHYSLPDPGGNALTDFGAGASPLPGNESDSTGKYSLVGHSPNGIFPVRGLPGVHLLCSQSAQRVTGCGTNRWSE